MPNGAAFAPIHTQLFPYAMPDVLRECVVTVLSSLPFQSTSHAASSGFGSGGTPYGEFGAVTFCCPIHRPPDPSVITASALGYRPGDLNNLVVFADRFGVAPRPRPSPAAAPPLPRDPRPARSGVAPPCARAIAEPMFSARPAASNSLRFMLMASPLQGVEIPRERSVGA